jgi:guanylate kinase
MGLVLNKLEEKLDLALAKETGESLNQWLGKKNMNNIKRLIIIGEGGSGKDHLRKILVENGFRYCVSHTTRPIREGEENGKDYWFIKSSNLKEMVDDFYEGVFFNNWFYGTSLDEFYSSNLFIMTPKGVEKLKPEDRKESSILYLNIDEETRRSRLESRRDADDVKRRLEADFLDFKDFTDFDLEISDPNFTLDSLSDILDTLTKNKIAK